MICLNKSLAQVNREEKSHADWTNRHILEQMNREQKKGKTVSFQSTSKKSMFLPKHRVCNLSPT